MGPVIGLLEMALVAESFGKAFAALVK